MSYITKKIVRGPGIQTTGTFWDTKTDKADDGTSIKEGDIFCIADSLFHPAETLALSTDNGLVKVRLNNLHTVYPECIGTDGYVYKVLASGVLVWESGIAPITIQANTNYVRTKAAISSMQIVAMSGNFTLEAF